MQWFKDRNGLDDFFEKFNKAEECVLMTDYDGTIAPFVFERHRAQPYSGIMPVLRKIMENKRNRLIIITGRTVLDQKEFLELDTIPEIWGTHGWERLSSNGDYEIWPVAENYKAGINKAILWSENQKLEGRLEKKPASLALHWRSATAGERLDLVKMVNDSFGQIAAEHGLTLHKFDGGLELQAPGRNKGDAVRKVLGELSENSAVAYLGDDSADEDAFSALGDKGLRILVGTTPKETEADLWLRPPRELTRFLQRWEREAVVRDKTYK